MNKTTIYVFDDFTFNTPCLIGNLFVINTGNKETYGFEYDENWLKKTNYSISIDPELETYKGIQYSTNGVFGFVLDSCPDRWGRVLIQRKEKQNSSIEKRIPKQLNDSDYLLSLSDELRTGGLRFKLSLDGDFVNSDSIKIPPFVFLRTLEEAARNIEDSKEYDNKYLDVLLNPGSSLGGARPKANVIDTDGNLWIAKFPSKHDDIDVSAWEKVAYDLAELVGLNVPQSKLEKLSKYGSTILVKRFDRNRNKRIHFASAMTLLNKQDGDNSSSYLDILDFIKSNGTNSKNDAKELWKRIVFNICINNNDDHLRNHSFILEKSGWRLSPLYDINPSPYIKGLHLNIDESSNDLSKELVLGVAKRFGINDLEAKEIFNLISSTISNNYKPIAKKYSIPNSEIEYMSSAFNSFKE